MTKSLRGYDVCLCIGGRSFARSGVLKCLTEFLDFLRSAPNTLVNIHTHRETFTRTHPQHHTASHLVHSCAVGEHHGPMDGWICGVGVGNGVYLCVSMISHSHSIRFTFYFYLFRCCMYDFPPISVICFITFFAV